MRTVNTQLLTTSTAIAQSQGSNTVKVDFINKADVTAVIASANPSNLAFTAAVSDLCTTATAHGFTSGVKVQFTTTTTLPAGLSLLTDYYLAVLSSTTFKVCTSQANVTAGTYVDITDTGTGTHTVAVVTTIAGNAKLQKNNNPPEMTAEWVTLLDGEIAGAATAQQSISGATTLNWGIPDLTFRELRVLVTITSGTVTADVRVHGKT